MEEYYQSKFRLRDGILIGAVLGFAVVAFLLMNTIGAKDGNIVRVSVNGETYGEYDLNTDQTIEIEIQGEITNVVLIEDGSVSMKEAQCPDHLCVEQGQIHLANESIICLPNKVVVEILDAGSEDDDSSNDEQEIDAVIK
ncbi:MAG: NusG domain II-containing protein [Eubacterium sp.]|nr:NusG domain II-containing protein [Eubacterium sp.]